MAHTKETVLILFLFLSRKVSPAAAAALPLGSNSRQVDRKLKPQCHITVALVLLSMVAISEESQSY